MNHGDPRGLVEQRPILPVGVSQVLVPDTDIDTLLDDTERAGVRRLHLPLSPEQWHLTEHTDRLENLFDRAQERFDVLPSLRAAEGSGDGDFETFVAAFAYRFGARFRWIELDCASGCLFYERPGTACLNAAKALRERGKRVVLAVHVPFAVRDAHLIDEEELLWSVDAVGLQATATSGEIWPGWTAVVERTGQWLAWHGRRDLPVWITASGLTDQDYRTRVEVEAFRELADVPVERAYWGGTRDADTGRTRGLYDAHGRPRLPLRLWQQGGAARLTEVLRQEDGFGPTAGREPTALITGGAGFIGANFADRLMREGWRVTVLDSLARPGTETNLEWLRREHADRLTFRLGDVRDPAVLNQAVAAADRVFHFAAQVAVTTSIEQPLDDFSVNGAGTLRLLEAIRRRDGPPPLLFTSTNKVYGGLDDLRLRRGVDTYLPEDPDIRARGIGEDRGLSFCSPYGCSKGSADQYVLDYARTFGLPACVFRMSCVYGPRQFGNEDQGWVAHFLIRALRGERITIFGDGCQVRDVLYVDDLVEAMLTAMAHMKGLTGEAFNIGGGPQNTLSLLQLIGMIEAINGHAPSIDYRQWRASDQRYYVSDCSKFTEATGWRPRTGVGDGVRRLHRWLDAFHREERAEWRYA